MLHLRLLARPARAASPARTLLVCCLLASFVLTPAAPVVAAAPDVAVPAAAGMAGAALSRAGAPAGNTEQVAEPPLVPDPNWQVEPPDPDAAPPAPVWDMGTAAPEVPPRVPAAVLLDVSSPAAVVAAGTPFTVAVSVSPSRADAPLPAGLMAHVQLPPGAAALDTTDSPMDWVLPLLAPGAAHTQTVQLVADGSAPLLGIEVTVSGADVLPVIQAQWFVVAPAGAAATGAADPQAPDASGGNAIDVAATTLGAQGAVVQSLAGGVTLALPHDAAPLGAVVHYTPRFDWRSAPPVPPAADATPAPAVPETPEALGARLFLPGIFGGSPDAQTATDSQAADALAPGGTGDPQASSPNVPSVQEGGITFYALWDLGAEVVAAAPTVDGSAAAATTSEAIPPTAGEVAQLQAEALLVVDVAELSAAGVNPRRLQVWTREETGEPWTPLHARYDDDAHVLRAWLPHFSQFGLGEGLTPSGDQLPSVEAFTADILSGGAGASVPFETPAGLGGLKPNLGLSYSSVTMDDLYLTGSDNAMTAQAGAGGFGWNLGGLSYIVRTDGKGDDDTLDGDKTFALVLNGERMAVTFVDAHWHTNPEIFARISWAGSVLSGTRDYAGWTVTTVDGVRYDFGDAFAYAGYRQDSATAYALANTNGNETFRQGRRWYLRQVTDPRGNSMEYHYKTERAYKTCQVESNWVSNGWNWYTSSVDPLEITWSGNPSQGADYKLRAIFVYSTTARTDTQVENWAPGSCNAAYAAQPLVGLWNKLSSLVVQVKDTGGNWQLLRSYDLVQGIQTFNAPTAKQRPYLSSVSARGQSGGLLRKYSFTYAFSNLNQVWLTKADNGWGGSVTYSYEDYRVSCAASVCGARNIRYPISTTVAYDGPSGWPRNSVQTNYYYGADNAGSEGGAVADDRGFLGFKLVEITHTEVNTPAVVLQREEVRSYEDGADASRENPDPRHGKVKERKILDAGGNVLQVMSYDWQAYWFLHGAWSATPTGTSWRTNDNDDAEYPPTWIRLEGETVTQGPLNTPGVPVNSSVYAYAQAQQNNTQYGNRTTTSEYVDGALKRRTETEYFPNTGDHIVNRPARVRVYDAAGACVGEVRSVYDRYDDPNNYQTSPTYGLLSETAKALVACSDAAALPKSDAGWQVERFGYDPYGNQITHHLVGAMAGAIEDSPDQWIDTEFDTTYHLFPVRRFDYRHQEFAETAIYYGVNLTDTVQTLAQTQGWAYWGALAQWCDVNTVCVRQAYDQHGRRALRWENQAVSDAWPDVEQTASVRWDYRDPLNNPTWNDVTVSEWRAPRCYGNFTRRHYNGFGQLTQAQTPDSGWQQSYDNCGIAAAFPPEVDVDYAYDGLGRQVRASVPHATFATWVNRAAYWMSGSTRMSYDSLGRVITSTAPNGEQTVTGYRGRQSKTLGLGRNGYSNKTLQWQEEDGLGNLLHVWTGGGSPEMTATAAATVTLAYDVLGNLVQVDLPSGATAVMTYDLGGRKTGMNDPDLGTWSYTYNRRGALRQQTDACGNVTDLTYDDLGRLVAQAAAPGALCATTAYTTAVLTTTYVYDGEHSDQSRSRGQLTGVSYGDGSYARSLGYNAKGQLVTETVALLGAPQVYTATYLYDGYDRLSATVYPDGEVVAAQGFDSRGLVTGLLSSGLVTPPVQPAVLVDNLRYDAAGRLARLRYATVNSSNGITLTHYYYNWTGNDGNANGRYWGMNVSTVAESADVMAARYAYDTYANLTYQAFTWQNKYSDANTVFAYDDQNRVTAAYGQGFGWQPWGSLGSVGGAVYGYAAGRPHAVELVNGADRYDYDANGNMVVRSKGVSGQEQALQWDADNRLAQVVSSSGVTETYLYDEHGQRIRRQAAYSSSVGDTVTYVPFVFYEQAVSAGGSVVAKHYTVNGERVAVRVGGALYYLYHDQVGSTILATDASSNVVSSRGYYAFGATRRSTGVTPTDRRFTGQVEDPTGLYYYNSRYYDPQLGQFLSPDTIVPEPTNLLSYNRYLYAKGNPLKYTDPSGHCATNENGDPDDNDSECWTAARTIYQMWDETSYWQDIWSGGKQHFIETVATQPIGAAYFQDRIAQYYDSTEYMTYREAHPLSGTTNTGELDWGDYTSLSLGPGNLRIGIILDDYGHVYLQLQAGLVGGGFSIIRGDIVIPDKYGQPKDIDLQGLNEDQKGAIAAENLVGGSLSASLSVQFMSVGGSINVPSFSSGTLESGFTRPTGPIAGEVQGSYTWKIYPFSR